MAASSMALWARLANETWLHRPSGSGGARGVRALHLLFLQVFKPDCFSSHIRVRFAPSSLFNLLILGAQVFRVEFIFACVTLRRTVEF